MKRREKLRENYEEALLALLMDERMEAEGARLLRENEQINGAPDEAVPDEVSRRGYKTIHRAFAKENFRLISKTAGQTIQRLSVAVFLIVALVSTAFAISPKFRVNSLNLLIEVSDIATSLKLTEKEKPDGLAVYGDGLKVLGYQLPRLPDSYTLQYENITDTYAMVMFRDQEGAEVRFSFNYAAGTTLTVDTENARNVETIVINGYEGILVEKPRVIEGELKERILITLGDTDENYFVNVTTTGLEKESAIKLAEQVVYVGGGTTIVKEENSDPTISNKSDEAGIKLMGYCFPALPDGFELLHESVSDTSATVIYANEEGDEVWFSVDVAKGNTLNIDTEDADLVETISVSGFQGLLVEKTYKFPDGEREQVAVVWGDIDHNYFVDVTTFELGRTVTLALAEQVAYVGGGTTVVKEENSDPTISNKSDKAGVKLRGYCFPALPDGFDVVHESESSLYSKVTYMNTVGEEVSFSVRKAEGTSLNIDTEGAHNVELVTINGYEGILVEKQYAIDDLTIDSVSVYWGDTERNVFINVVCTDLSREYALELAKKVYYE